jgi:acyl-CoA thioesterase YciA
MMPRDTNAMGTIFGGVILSYLDQAGAVEAHRHTAHPVVTVAMREVVFRKPVFVGDLVSFHARTRRVGKTSVTVRVDVVADRLGARSPIPVTHAEVVYVAVDGRRKAVPLRP